MKVLKNILPLDCKNDNCIIKMSSFSEGFGCVTGVKKMDAFLARQDIFYENNSVDGVYFILKGVVKVYKENSNNSQIVRLAKDGDVLGHRGIGRGGFPISAQALSNTELCFIEKERFFELLDSSSSLATNLMLFFADELNLEERKTNLLNNFSVYEKGIFALNIMIDSFGLTNDQLINHSDLLTRQEMGELVGVTANQITKVLRELQDENLINITKKGIVILKRESIMI